MTIHLGAPVAKRLLRPTRAARLETGLAVLRPPRRPYSVLLPVGFAVPSLLPRTRCALTAPFHPYLPLPGSFGGRFAFCCTVPGVAPAGNYPAPCFHGARTFLPALIRNAGRAAIRPADSANKGRSACYVKALLAGHCGAR